MAICLSTCPPPGLSHGFPGNCAITVSINLEFRLFRSYSIPVMLQHKGLPYNSVRYWKAGFRINNMISGFHFW